MADKDKATESKSLDIEKVLEDAQYNLNTRNILLKSQRNGLFFLPSSFQNADHIRNAIKLLSTFVDYLDAEEG